MYKIICEKDNKLYCVADYLKNKFADPTYLSFNDCLSKAKAVCKYTADDIENILGENGYKSFSIKVADTEPLYSIYGLEGGEDIYRWSQKYPITYEYLLGHFYSLTLDNETFSTELNWEKDFIRDKKKEDTIKMIEAFFNVKIFECQHSKKARVVVSEILKDITKVFCLQFTRKERQFYMNQYELLPEYLEESVKRQRIYNLILLNSRGK